MNAQATEPPAAIAELTRGGAHVSVDALGVAATCRNSILSLRKRGRHLQIGLTTSAEQGMISVPIDLLVLKECSNEKVRREETSTVLEAMDRFTNVGVTVIDRY